MKKAKTITALLTAVTMTLGAMGVTAYAQTDTEKAIEDVLEYSKATNKFIKDFDGKLDDEEYYVWYNLGGLYDYNHGKYTAETFEELIRGEIRTYVKIGNKLATIVDRNGELTIAQGETLPIGYKSVLELHEEEQKLRQQIDEEIIDVKYCGFQGMGCIYLSVIYFKTADGKELCVPYIDNYNFGKEGGRFDGIIENGRIYTGEELIEILKNVIDVLDESNFDELGNVITDDGVPNTGIIGDVNGDGMVNARDCSVIARAVAGRYTQALHETADYNRDGKIDVRDAAAIANVTAHYLDCLDCSNT